MTDATDQAIDPAPLLDAATTDDQNLDYPDGIDENAPLHAQISELTANVQELQTKLSDAVAEADHFRQLLADKAKLPSVTRGAKAPKPRKLGPAGVKTTLNGSELRDRLLTEPHVVAFSDGETEIAVLEPLVLQPDAWTQTVAGMVLTTRVEIAPDRAIEIAGFALIDAKGQQIAWSQLASPIKVAPGTQLRLDRQIIF